MGSLLFDRHFGVSVFHHAMGGGEDKMEVIEESVSNFVLVFYYQLTLSRSDFTKCYTR